jgi:aspartate/tyrosine/aromatic aminotransferase
LSADSILGLMARYRADPSAHKVDLGVGVFRDLAGNTPVLDCVRRAEREVLAAQTTKSYVGAAGREEFNSSVEALVLGADHTARRDRRTRTVQTPGGCGALRVGAELIRAAVPAATVHVSDPTWGNHIPLLGSSGLRLDKYPYYDAPAHQLRFDAMMEHINQAPSGDVILIHGCCHNPTGADLSLTQWETLAQVLQQRRLLPFLDLAYQGFGTGLEADAAGVRLVAAHVPEALIAVSYSKNLGLYRERVGALISIGATEERANAMLSHVLQIARSIYSMPPDHGAAIAAHIFGNAALSADWMRELDAMRVRMAEMRNLLADELRLATGDKSFDFIRAQRGMFSLLGVSGAAVDRLRDEHHIYMLGDSRMNVAGIMPHNAAYVANAVAKTIVLERAA